MRRPPWADLFETPDYPAFLAAVETYFTSRGYRVAFTDAGALEVLEGEVPYDRVLGLTNLAQGCAREPRDRWPPLIEAHFNAMFASAEEAEQLADDLLDFDRAAPHLRVRVFEADSLPPLTVDVSVCYPGPPGTVTMLVLDLPSAIRTLQREVTDRWGRTDTELFATAVSNHRADPIKDIVVPLEEGGAEFHLVTGDAYYSASHYLRLDELLPASPHGLLVALPRRDAIFAHVIKDRSVLAAVERLFVAALNAYEDGPGSISPNLFWYRTGHFTRLPIEEIEGVWQFNVPDSFTEMLNDLPEQE